MPTDSDIVAPRNGKAAELRSFVERGRHVEVAIGLLSILILTAVVFVPLLWLWGLLAAFIIVCAFGIKLLARFLPDGEPK